MDLYLKLHVLAHPIGRHLLDLKLVDVANSRAATKEWPSLLEYLHLDGTALNQLSLSELLTLNTGWYLFEMSEPGYLRALYHTFNLIFENNEFNLSLVFKLHAHATRTVRHTNYDDKRFFGESSGGQIRSLRNIAYPITTNNSSVEGIYELLQRRDPHAYFKIPGLFINADTPALLRSLEKQTGVWPTRYDGLIHQIKQAQDEHQLAQALFDYTMQRDADMKKMIYVSSIPHDEDEAYLVRTAEKFIARYHQSINGAKTSIEKIAAIVDVVQALEQLHIFSDANCRTLCMSLLNHLLITNHFPLCISFNPNKFDACSRNELIEMVASGMENTRELVMTGQLFGVNTEAIMDLPNQLNNPVISKKYFGEVINIEERARRRACMQHKSNANKRTFEQMLVK